MDENIKLGELLAALSEESLYQLSQFARRRTRRQSLRLQAGREADDLPALRVLQAAADAAHERRLYGP